MGIFGNFRNCLLMNYTYFSKTVLIRNLWKEQVQNFHSMKNPLYFQCSPVLCGEPLKKKKRIDPSMLRERSERKMRRIAREIRRHEKVARKLKPIAELEVPKQILKDTGKAGETRKRPVAKLSEEEKAYRADLLKEWGVYKRQQHLSEIFMINRIMDSQEKALDQLKEVSEELYEEALQVDATLIPFQMVGPVETPPIMDYEHPEGQYVDVTKKYLPIATEPKKVAKFVKKKRA